MHSIGTWEFSATLKQSEISKAPKAFKGSKLGRVPNLYSIRSERNKVDKVEVSRTWVEFFRDISDAINSGTRTEPVLRIYRI